VAGCMMAAKKPPFRSTTGGSGKGAVCSGALSGVKEPLGAASSPGREATEAAACCAVGLLTASVAEASALAACMMAA
jgi:hypothetical protein